MDDWEDMVTYIGPPATELEAVGPTPEDIRVPTRLRDAVIVLCFVVMGMAVAHAWHANSVDQPEVVATAEARP
jgi:hypothetical protein